MASNFQQAIEIIRERATNDTEVGTAFEKLSKVFFENDATQTQQYSKVWHYSDLIFAVISIWAVLDASCLDC